MILALAVALRLAGLRWGLPDARHYFSYHPDEIFLLQPSFGFARGDWNPHFFNYGTLYIYLVGLPATFLNLTNVPFPQGLAPLYLLGRVISALLGVGSVALLYLALKRESRALALLGAALLAVLPLHVVDSHYATVDVAATFFLVLALVFALRGEERPELKWAIPTGLAVGLAAATKYNVGLFLLPVLAAPLLPPRQRVPWLWFGGILLGALAGFFIGCPYVSDPKFLKDFLFEVNHARTGGTYAFVGTGSGWGYHLLHGLPIALGFPLLLALIPGAIAAIRLPSRAARLSLLWCLLYFLTIGVSKERFVRYLVPMAPFLAVLAAWGLLWLMQAARTHLVRMAAFGVVAVVVVLTALYTVGQIVPLVTPDPRDRAATQLERVLNGPSLSSLRIGLTQAPWYFTPPVAPDNAGPASRPLFEQWNWQSGNRIVITGWEAAKLRAGRPDAFVLSDLESMDLLRLKDEAATGFVSTLASLYPQRDHIARPTPPFAWLAPGRAWAPPDWLYGSPGLTIYSDARPHGT